MLLSMIAGLCMTAVFTEEFAYVTSAQEEKRVIINLDGRKLEISENIEKII